LQHVAVTWRLSRGVQEHRSPRTRAQDDPERISKIVDDGEYLDIELDEDELDALIAEVGLLPPWAFRGRHSIIRPLPTPFPLDAG
jgi:hypothetical protein